MRNDECTIRITTRRGWTQTYCKGKAGWTQETNGTKRPLTAEQLLSHLLPLLVAGNKRAVVRVEKRAKAKRVPGTLRRRGKKGIVKTQRK